MINRTATASFAFNESSFFWGFFYYFGRACGTRVLGMSS